MSPNRIESSYLTIKESKLKMLRILDMVKTDRLIS
jgi:hypothetical protein